MSLGFGFVDVGEFFDEFAEVRGGDVEEGEEGVDELGGGEGGGLVG